MNLSTTSKPKSQPWSFSQELKQIQVDTWGIAFKLRVPLAEPVLTPYTVMLATIAWATHEGAYVARARLSLGQHEQGRRRRPRPVLDAFKVIRFDWEYEECDTPLVCDALAILLADSGEPPATLTQVAVVDERWQKSQSTKRQWGFQLSHYEPAENPKQNMVWLGRRPLAGSLCWDGLPLILP